MRLKVVGKGAEPAAAAASLVWQLDNLAEFTHRMFPIGPAKLASGEKGKS